jgi:Ribosomal protein L18
MVKRLKFKRRFLNLTNYAKRKVFVESGKLRLVVRFSNRYILAQIIKAEIRGDNCLVSVHSSELKKLGWPFSLKNIPASYLVGYMIGKKALKKGIEEVALDIGLKMPTKGARVFAVAKGAIDAGLKLPINEEVIPDEKELKVII